MLAFSDFHLFEFDLFGWTIAAFLEFSIHNNL